MTEVGFRCKCGHFNLAKGGQLGQSIVLGVCASCKSSNIMVEFEVDV